MTEHYGKIDINKTNDQEWATIRDLPGHIRITPTQDPHDSLYDPNDNTQYREHARIIGGHPVLDVYFTDPDGEILMDDFLSGRRDRWAEVRGLKPDDGWTPIKRDQQKLKEMFSLLTA